MLILLYCFIVHHNINYVLLTLHMTFVKTHLSKLYNDVFVCLRQMLVCSKHELVGAV